MSTRRYYLSSTWTDKTRGECREVSRKEYLQEHWNAELAAICEEGGYDYTGAAPSGDIPGLVWMPGARGIRLPDLDKRFPLRDPFFPEGPPLGMTTSPAWWMRKTLEELGWLLPDLRSQMVAKYAPGGVIDAERLGSQRALLKEQIAREEKLAFDHLRNAREMLAAWEVEALYRIARSDADREQRMRRLKGWIVGAASMLWDKLLIGWHHVEIDAWCRQVVKAFPEVPPVFSEFQAAGLGQCAFERDRLLLGEAAAGLFVWLPSDEEKQGAEAEHLRRMMAFRPGTLTLEVRRIIAEEMIQAALRGQGVDAVVQRSYVFYGFEDGLREEAKALLPEILAGIEAEPANPEMEEELSTLIRRTREDDELRATLIGWKNDAYKSAFAVYLESLYADLGSRAEVERQYHADCDRLHIPSAGRCLHPDRFVQGTGRFRAFPDAD